MLSDNNNIEILIIDQISIQIVFERYIVSNVRISMYYNLNSLMTVNSVRMG